MAISYRERVRRYLAAHPGATRQQARGHKAAEHIERKRRVEQKGGISDTNMRWLRRQVRLDPQMTLEKAKKTALKYSPQELDAMRIASGKMKKRKSENRGMEKYGIIANIPDEDDKWLLYFGGYVSKRHYRRAA